jgi:hypothetical protein
VAAGALHHEIQPPPRTDKVSIRDADKDSQSSSSDLLESSDDEDVGGGNAGAPAPAPAASTPPIQEVGLKEAAATMPLETAGMVVEHPSDSEPIMEGEGIALARAMVKVLQEENSGEAGLHISATGTCPCI